MGSTTKSGLSFEERALLQLQFGNNSGAAAMVEQQVSFDRATAGDDWRKPRTTPKPPPPVDLTDAALVKRALAEKRGMRAGRGVSSTFLTGQSATGTTPPKSLLGGGR